MLPLDDYLRYGRQMILDGFGLPAQLKLRQASVVVVGAGGLGCPALQYLGAAGIGRLAIIDHDRVELSNLGRQILHNENTVGMNKAASAAEALKKLNSHLVIDIHQTFLSPENARSLLESYDIILDCTDNAPTRYLLSDTAVTLRKPLVSGAAQKFEGQLCVYNLGEDGPCYRCLYPKPPAPHLIGTCEETGILGAVTGIIGTLQALETIKIITGLHDKRPTLLLYSAFSMPPFRSIKLRSRKPACPACGTENERLGRIETIDYVHFCGGRRPDWVKEGLIDGVPGTRAHVTDLDKALKSGEAIRVIDVRPETEYGICQLPSSISVPLHLLVANPEEYLSSSIRTPTYVICRLGNDSQIAADSLRSACTDRSPQLIKDVIGGLRAWSKEIDPSFPMY